MTQSVSPIGAVQARQSPVDARSDKASLPPPFTRPQVAIAGNHDRMMAGAVGVAPRQSLGGSLEQNCQQISESMRGNGLHSCAFAHEDGTGFITTNITPGSPISVHRPGAVNVLTISPATASVQYLGKPIATLTAEERRTATTLAATALEGVQATVAAKAEAQAALVTRF